MSARQLPAPDAAAFRLAALLEQYEKDVELLAATWRDAGLYERVGQEIAEMRLLCAGLPMLSVPSVQVLISHAELVCCLWARSANAEPPCRCAPFTTSLLAAVRALREQCLEHFTAIERGP